MSIKSFIIKLFIIYFFTTSCVTSSKVTHQDKTILDALLDQWHTDAANFRFDSYFDTMDSASVFIGTDATEIWSKEEFMIFSKPYFDSKQTWDFKPLQRNLYFDKSGKTAWFDELLDTWMGLCRGSGVLIRTKEGWKIKQYVLSVTVPNQAIDSVIKNKKEPEEQQINLLKNLQDKN